MTQHIIRAGDVVRTESPVDGWHYGGVVQRVDGEIAWVSVEGAERPFRISDLVASESMAASLATLEREVGALLDEGYTQHGDRVEISRPAFDAMLAVFRKARWPTGIPRTRPMVVQLEEQDPASWWKLL